MDILVLAPFDPDELARLRRVATVRYESWVERRHMMAPDELSERLCSGGHDAVVVEAEFVTADVFEAVPGLRCVASARGKPVNVDLEAATRSGCVVLQTPGRNAASVADLCLAMILDRARHIGEAARLVREGGWVIGLDDDHLVPYIRFRGFELGGRLLGLIGLGAVARQVAVRARAFGMRLAAYDPHLPAAVFHEHGVESMDLEPLLAAADVVSVHVELSPDTIGMLDGRRLRAMRPGAILVNTARAQVVDIDAATRLLQEGHLGGLAVDVFAPEPVPSGHPLLREDHALLLPHIGGATHDVVRHHSAMIRTDIELLLGGERPLRCANPVVLDQVLTP